jgi:non-heme chloroperoxidase
MKGNKELLTVLNSLMGEQMRAGIANSHLVVFEKSGHSLFLEETHKFNTELIKFAGK